MCASDPEEAAVGCVAADPRPSGVPHPPCQAQRPVAPTEVPDLADSAMPLIHIEGWPEPVQAGRQRILEAALDAGVPYPHGCGAGECGSCKSRLLEGEVKSDRHSPEALSDEEEGQGLILACRSRPVGDVRVQWLGDSTGPSMTKVDASVAAIDLASPDVIVLTLDLPLGRTFEFRPGQFAKLRFGELPARSYSMANLPGQGQLVFHIRVLPDGKVSPYVARGLRTGERVEVRGPFGAACWDGPQPDGALLLLGGGTGMAPIMSVLDAALRDGHPAQQIHVYHGVRTGDDLYVEELLQRRVRDHGIHFVPVFAEQRAAGVRAGPLHEAIASDFNDLGGATVHVAGPPPMVEAVRQLVISRGAAPSRVRAEAFHPAEPDKRSLWERITSWGSL